ncbi:MAG TPA: Gfo/Idh/MocA family oxidoreductase, partial [Planctomycetota bacterium]|nr:Gfo/Idh/MocA family oxidoreductase [Planctomycetota bacterium]
AVADVNEAEARRVADENKIPTVYTDWRKLLESKEIDAVDVCLHNNLHAPVTIAALEAGKHAYCEKPMAGSYIDAKAMSDAAKKTGRKLHIQLSTLYSWEHKVAQQLIQDGQLGKIYYVRSFGFRRRGRPFVDGYGTPAFVQKKNSGGGALFDMGIYHIAQVLHLIGNPVVETASGSTHQEVGMNAERQKSSGYDVEELGLGFVRLAGGITLSIEESWAIHYDGSESSRIHGSKGGVKLNPLTFFSQAGDIETTATLDSGAAFRIAAASKDPDIYESSQHHWVAALQGRVPLLDTAGIALNVALISEGIYQSQAQKRELKASEILEASKSTALKL